MIIIFFALLFAFFGLMYSCSQHKKAAAINRKTIEKLRK